MPTYEYECDACQHRFEEFQSMKDEPLKKCPQCKKKKLRRLFGTGAALLFKGSGFYITDYRSEGYKAAAKADSSSSAPASSSTETKSTASESKPAADSGGSKSSDKGSKKK
jgi:putative FmdB family regulatory protein